MTNISACPDCRGEGKIITDPCKSCRGSGRVRKQRTIEINIPQGINNGQTMQVSGQGEPGLRGGPSGDLLVTISLKPHPIFKREDFDVFINIPITFVQAALGATIRVPTLDGVVEYDIPEGTQSGTVFKLRGKGVPYIRGKNRGDEYVTVEVEIPKNINSKQKAILKEFDEASSEKDYKKRHSWFDKMKDFIK